MLDHQVLRNLRSAASLVASAREADVSDLTDEEHTKVDEILSQLIGDAIVRTNQVRAECGGGLKRP